MRTFHTLVGVVAVLLVATTVGPVAAAQRTPASAPVEITSCTTIDRPGRYALGSDLRGDVAGHCIEITAGDVVLDGRGHAVVGGERGTGIGVDSAAGRVTNVSVVDVTTRHWDVGVRLAAVDDATLRGVDASRNVVGVRVENASAVTLHGSTFARNVRDGVFAVDSTGVEMHDSTVRANGAFGVDLSRVRESTLRGNDVSENRFIGVRLARSTDNRLVDNRIEGNENVGVELHTRSRGNVLRNNTVAGHGWDGIRLGRTSRTVVVANEILGNRMRGVALFNTSDGRFVDNLVRSNGRTGVEVRDSPNVSLVGNDVRENGDDDEDLPIGKLAGGVFLYRSDDARLVDNEVVENPVGVQLLFSDGAVIRETTVVGSRVDVWGSDGATVTTNRFRNASMWLWVASENAVTNNTFESGDVVVDHAVRATPFRYTSSDDNRIADNVVSGELTVRGGVGNTVVGNEISGPGDGVVLRDDYDFPLQGTTVRNNVVRDNTGTGIRLDGAYVGAAAATTVAGNRIVDNEAGVVLTEVGDVTVSGGVIRDNNRSGVVLDRVGTVTVARTRVVDNRGDGVAVVGPGPDWTATEVTVRDSILVRNRDGVSVSADANAEVVSIRDSFVAGNRAFGVSNDADGVVDATDTYWGASNGPGSDESDPDAPFADPVTGTLAAGGGDAVSEDPSEPGVSNVRFDPYLTDPTVSGVSAPGPPVVNSSARTTENPAVIKRRTAPQTESRSYSAPYLSVT